MGECHFGNIILPATGKKGILKPDDEGYYILNGGGFNIPNRLGIKYTVNDYILESLSENSDLRRRLKRGEVQGEMGHPPRYYLKMVNGQVVRHDITNVFEWILRLRTIDPDRVCMLISDIYAKWDNEHDTKSPLHISYRLKPFGPFGSLFKEHLDTPSANTSISLRSVITPTNQFDRTRNVEYWTGADWVVEAGMEDATKWHTDGCESLDLNNYYCGSLNLDDDTIIIDSRSALNELAKALDNASANKELAGCEAFDAAQEVYDRLKGLSKNNELHVMRKVSTMNIF